MRRNAPPNPRSTARATSHPPRRLAGRPERERPNKSEHNQSERADVHGSGLLSRMRNAARLGYQRTQLCRDARAPLERRPPPRAQPATPDTTREPPPLASVPACVAAYGRAQAQCGVRDDEARRLCPPSCGSPSASHARMALRDVFHSGEVTPTLVHWSNVHISQNATKPPAASRLNAVAELAHDLVLGRPEAGLTHGRFAPSRVEAGAACRSFFSFEGSFWLFCWHLAAPDNGEQRLPGGIMSRSGSLVVLRRADPARLTVARARQC